MKVVASIAIALALMSTKENYIFPIVLFIATGEHYFCFCVVVFFFLTNIKNTQKIWFKINISVGQHAVSIVRIEIHHY